MIKFQEHIPFLLIVPVGQVATQASAVLKMGAGQLM